MILLPHIEVDYDDPSHRYYYGTITYRSATQILERFIPEFDTIERSEYMSFRYGNTPEYWREKWKLHNGKSLVRGNLIHNQKEDFLHGRGYESVHGKHFRVYNINMPIIKDVAQTQGYISLADGVYPELKLWHHEWGIAGRVDKPIIETIGDSRYLHIDDYKTNAAINMYSFQDKEGNYRMMLEPLNHLMDCEYNHYCLQLSLYQYMGEYFGFKPGRRRIIHYPHPIPGLGTPDPKIYDDLPYLRNEVISILKYLKHEKWLQIN